MKIIRVSKAGNYTHHGIGYTEHDGYAGTADNRWSLKLAVAYEVNRIRQGEQYQIEINGVNQGTFTK